ncbi:hypothetical protein P175DRAFT_0508236 [Aspergillus ochraceoroseus IBT 24754]|uniref:Uncharacterized protein n=1 Tax=Aspergillus ochraceoroseus IBT 24754 TaxID=1392256 RepID=A0A2T5M4X1_9EURO|nr:uncharacterized protein P175DRAFT_0508236 [Aspergillus ochraceoroseus IBT 24754]PTU23579.1 hypothetical protein P175DRAFT_0508236 [Aspergillus ochraceoroseus IBT 24754]
MALGDSYMASTAEKQVICANRGVSNEGPEKDVLGRDKEIEYVEAVAAEKQTIGKCQKIKQHFARFRYYYLLAGILFLAIFLPVLFLLVIPAIAQRVADDTNITVYSATMMNPKPDAVTLTLNTSLAIPLGLRVGIDPLNINLFNRDSNPRITYLTVPLPEYSLKGTTNLVATSNNTPVLDEDEFVRALAMAVYSKKITLSAGGEPTVHLGALKAHLKLDKDVELAGLDKLNGFSIDEAAFLLPALPDGSNLNGKATLPNHSVVTFALGNVTLNLMAKNIVLGTARLENVILQPGNNSVNFTAKADIKHALDNIGSILKAEADALRSGDIELSASGNQTVYNGVHIPYFERVLNNLTITARVPIISILLDTVGQFLGDGADGVVNTLDTILNKVNFASLFKHVDFTSLVDSLGDIIKNINLGTLLEGVNINQLLQDIDWKKVIDGIKSILSQLDLGGFLQSLDLGKLLSEVDWTSLMQSIVNLLKKVDWTAVTNAINSILKNIDLGAIIEKIAPLLKNLDLEQILSNLDIGKTIDELTPVLKDLDLGSILKQLDWGTIIKSVMSILKNIDLPSLLKTLLTTFQTLHLRDLLYNVTIGGINIGDFLQKLANDSGNVSLDQALNNLQHAWQDIGGRGGSS